MIKKVYENKNMIIYLHPENSILEQVLNLNINQEAEFKSELMNFIQVFDIYKVKKTLWNLKNFEMPIPTQLQKWIDEEINSKEIEMGVKKEAFVMPDDFISQMSVEKTMEETYGKKIVKDYFKSRDEALFWLKQ